MANSKKNKGSIPERLTGLSVPLGAAYTKKNTVIGEFTVLPELAKICKSAGLGIIQLLPINDTGTQSSPYSGLSAFALHPIYIDIKEIPEFQSVYNSNKDFSKSYDEMIKNFSYDPNGRYKYQEILNAKTNLLQMIYETTKIAEAGIADEELKVWIDKNPWIIQYSVYKNLKYKYMQASWKEWAKEDQTPSQKEILSRWNDPKLMKNHLFYAWVQMRAAKQFKESTDAVRKAGIILKGDMPILMNEDSCDAWACPDIFNHNLRAGSPVDNENPTGQNWGFPTYNWDVLKKNKFSWWIDRLKSAEQYYSAYRLDHILGFFRIWAIPASDTTAVLGHTVPYVPITKEQLNFAGFDDGRIRWLSKPHVSTGLIEDITWNHETATAILNKFMNRIGTEELWLFKDSIKGDKDIYAADLSAYCEGDAQQRVKDALSMKWRDRCLIEITPDCFVPVWTYYNSTAWNSLNEDEKNRLKSQMARAEVAQDKLWESQSDEILSTLTGSVNMVPCGEDLGANLACLPGVMEKNGILALRVTRWCRKWDVKPEMPYKYLPETTPLSVTTSSVHDSTTLRQWWQEDRDGASLFARSYAESFGVNPSDFGEVQMLCNAPFSEKIAEGFLQGLAKSGSCWCIHPMGDFLSLSEKYWLANPDDERINVPGSVTDFNWTYRLPAYLEDIAKDKKLLEKIKKIADLHKNKL